MNITEYASALLAWGKIDNHDADEVLRRVVLMGNGMLYAATTSGDLYQWHRWSWKRIGIGNQVEGMTMPVAEEL